MKRITEMNNFEFQNLLDSIWNKIKWNEKISSMDWAKKYYKFYVSYKISKSFWSSMTIEKAEDIFDKVVNKNISDSEYLGNINQKVQYIFENNMPKTEEEKKLIENELQQLYLELEYRNILKTLHLIDISNSKLYNTIKEKWITRELLSFIHEILTNGFDQIFAHLYDKKEYFSGYIRESNNIKVWEKQVCSVEEMNEILDYIEVLSKNIKSIYDIYHIHWLLYYSHPFYNGNKRIARIVEEILMNYYNFTEWAATSIGYHLLAWEYCDGIVDYCFTNKSNINEYNLEWINLCKCSTIISMLEQLNYIYTLPIRETIDSYNLDNRFKEDFLMMFTFRYNDLNVHIWNNIWSRRMLTAKEIKDDEIFEASKNVLSFWVDNYLLSVVNYQTNDYYDDLSDIDWNDIIEYVPTQTYSITDEKEYKDLLYMIYTDYIDIVDIKIFHLFLHHWIKEDIMRDFFWY